MDADGSAAAAAAAACAAAAAGVAAAKPAAELAQPPPGAIDLTRDEAGAGAGAAAAEPAAAEARLPPGAIDLTRDEAGADAGAAAAGALAVGVATAYATLHEEAEVAAVGNGRVAAPPRAPPAGARGAGAPRAPSGRSAARTRAAPPAPPARAAANALPLPPPQQPPPPSFGLRGLVACADGSAPLLICDGEQAAAMLIECQPQHVVLFEPELETIRQVEVYAACRALAAFDEAEPEEEGGGAAGSPPGSPQPPPPPPPPRVSVHLCVFDGSVEEQRYLTSVRTEREAFRRLISERGSMVLPDFAHEAEQDPDDEHARAAANGGVYSARPRVIVDVREFRSSLPFQLHRAGVELVPATLEVGDYVLSPQVCVERKSLSDLIDSFKSGRLHHQVETMCRHYKEPVLLIELDPGRPFMLQHPSELSGDIAPSALSSKLSLLLLHFPQLRLIWAHGAASTVVHFQGLKAKRDQPETGAAVAAGQETEAAGADGSVGGLSLVAQDMLRRMPGVNAHNVHKLMRKAESLRGLAQMEPAELAGCIGAQCAKQLAAFLDTAPTEEG